MSASEAFTMPGIVTISDATLSDHLVALDALGGKLVLVALGTIDVMLLGDEGFGANGVMAGAADKALFMPLPRLVLHFLHACTEDIAASVTSGGKLSVIARSTIDSIGLRSKLLVHE